VKAAKNKFYRTTSVGNQVSQYLALKEKMANKENPVICFGEKHFGDYYLDLLGEDRYRKMKELSAKLSSSL
jgi:hypothetical protein